MSWGRSYASEPAIKRQERPAGDGWGILSLFSTGRGLSSTSARILQNYDKDEVTLLRKKNDFYPSLRPQKTPRPPLHVF